MATGLGKTVTFANIDRPGRMLILSHREELVRQPLRYFSCRTGVEMAGESASPMDEVVSASVMSLTRRLERFVPGEFDIIVVDECHHAGAVTYRRILEHFTPRLTLGFTATPNRSDGVRLDDVFSLIIFDRDLKWGIENGYLSDIHCRRVHIGYDLSRVHTRMGDYAPGELEEAMDGTADAIAQAYRDYAKGPTLVFAVSVRQAEEIATRIPGAVVVTGQTKDRQRIIGAFTAGEIPCIVNVMVFTEGTDLPLVETIIIARPTQSDTLYTQMVGRGLRVHPGKERLNLIDCVGVTGKASLCTAPSLLGVDLRAVPEDKQDQLQGDLFDLPSRAVALSDTPESWVMNTQIVNLWAKEQKYQTHGVAWFKCPDGRLVLSLQGKKVTMPCQNDLGRVVFAGREMGMQEAFDLCFTTLRTRYAEQEYLWNIARVNRWGKAPASEKQKSMVQRFAGRCKGIDITNLTKKDASLILNRLFAGKGGVVWTKKKSRP
jgi:type I site-specific restriction endonuclease